jgi:rhodanese-related sulfurtransferase
LKILQQPILEALLLITAAAVMGFAYTFVTKQGFFSAQKSGIAAASTNLEMISLEKAKELYESQDVLFIDARHNFEYKAGHIHGSINIALNTIDTNQIQLESIPKEKILVIYCDGVECNSSIELALKLLDLKYSNVKIFFGGWQEWKKNNYPVDYQ